MLCWPAHPIQVFYHDVDPKAGEHAASLLKSQSLPVFSSPLTYAAYMDIPTTYLFTQDDRSLPVMKQELMVSEARKAGAKIETETWKCAHSPFLIDPDAVAGLIRRRAGENGGEKL